MKKIENWWENLKRCIAGKMRLRSTQVILSFSFTLVSVCSTAILGVSLYNRFVDRMEKLAMENVSQLLNQTSINLETYLRSMRRISDTMYYSVIKDKDLAEDTLDEEMNLLYEANKNNLISIACYTNAGEFVAAAPVSNEKTQLDITTQQWFGSAVSQMENLHFSTPHVQNLFDDPSYRYYWVISLSRAVELTNNGSSQLGVLLVDMNYSSIEQMLNKANMDNASEYVYLMDGNGELIYHPKQKLIYAGLYEENNRHESHYEDGTHWEEFGGEQRLVTTRTISYTGWKLVSVVPRSALQMGLYSTRTFVISLVALSMLMIFILNQLVSSRIAKPLQRLNESVREWEAGNTKPDIYIGGTQEVEHLGKTLRTTFEQINQLMQGILREQEEKRKSELDALQSQINPHFLYNTLDSIVWMIEGERYEDAVFMITQLASLFRISLSRGKTVICIEDEIRHAKNYMNIQKVRYKNTFSFDFQVDDEVLNCCTVKLVLQPLLENAIYYGVEGMEDDGEIHVRAYRDGADVYMEVCDNGLGMPQEMVEKLLTENNRVHKRGSGVGVINVHNRIALRFGKQYGLEIISQPDEGTVVRVHLPYLEYSPQVQEQLERRGANEIREE